MNCNFTLYYPTIEFRDKEWLWNACLLWDKIYRIVPQNYKPCDLSSVQQIITNSDIISDIDPSPYAPDISLDFIEGLKSDRWPSAALSSTTPDSSYVLLHEGKADVQLKELLISSQKDNEGFYRVSQEFAAAYMMYLSNHIAKKNNLYLSTDSDFSWICSNFFEYEGKLDDDVNRGENLTPLATLTFSDFIPAGLENISAVDLLHFRKRSRDERKHFFQQMKSLSDKIITVNDPQVVSDILNENTKDFQKSKSDYYKRMRDIKIEGFYGVKTVMFPLISTAASAFTKLPDNISQLLNLCGICCGVIGGIWDVNRKIQAEKPKYMANYLIQMKHKLPYYYNSKHYAPYNYSHLDYYHMYLNDRLNEFIYD